MPGRMGAGFYGPGLGVFATGRGQTTSLARLV
jgi:hypothetical protein